MSQSDHSFTSYVAHTKPAMQTGWPGHDLIIGKGHLCYKALDAVEPLPGEPQTIKKPSFQLRDAGLVTIRLHVPRLSTGVCGEAVLMAGDRLIRRLDSWSSPLLILNVASCTNVTQLIPK